MRAPMLGGLVAAAIDEGFPRVELHQPDPLSERRVLVIGYHPTPTVRIDVFRPHDAAYVGTVQRHLREIWAPCARGLRAARTMEEAVAVNDRAFKKLEEDARSFPSVRASSPDLFHLEARLEAAGKPLFPSIFSEMAAELGSPTFRGLTFPTKLLPPGPPPPKLLGQGSAPAPRMPPAPARRQSLGEHMRKVLADLGMVPRMGSDRVVLQDLPRSERALRRSLEGELDEMLESIAGFHGEPWFLLGDLPHSPPAARQDLATERRTLSLGDPPFAWYSGTVPRGRAPSPTREHPPLDDVAFLVRYLMRGPDKALEVAEVLVDGGSTTEEIAKAFRTVFPELVDGDGLEAE